MLTSIRLLSTHIGSVAISVLLETSSDGSLFYFAYSNIIFIFVVQTISTIVDKASNIFVRE